MLTDGETGALKRRRPQKGTSMITQQPTTTATGPGQSLLALYPEPERTALEGLYLSHDLRRCRRGGDPFVYSNFIASLDGRIAVADPAGR